MSSHSETPPNGWMGSEFGLAVKPSVKTFKSRFGVLGSGGVYQTQLQLTAAADHGRQW